MIQAKYAIYKKHDIMIYRQMEALRNLHLTLDAGKVMSTADLSQGSTPAWFDSVQEINPDESV